MFNNTQVIPPIIVTFKWEQDVFPKQLNPHTRECLLRILKEKLVRLVNQDSCGLKKKFFNGNAVYTIKLNNDDRVLFNQVKTNATGGETLLVLEEVVINHDYQKAVTLRGAFRSDSVDWSSLNDLTELESVGYSCYKSKPLTELSVEALMEHGVENNVYFKKAWRSLTAVQQSIYSQPLPLLISGPPGSGKTMVSLALLQQRAVMHQTSGEGEVTYLYLTKSTFLCKEMAEQWREWASVNLKSSQQPVKVMFLTPEQLLVSSVLSDEEVSRCEGVEECLTYLRNTRGASIRDINLVYQELLLASAQLNQDESKRYSDSAYSAYGIRQSLLSAVDREWAFNVYRSYQQHLKSEKRVHLPFYQNSCFSERAVDDKLKFDLVIADESQDISTQLLVWASRFARNDAVVFCMDNHQNLSSPLSNAVFLKQYFHDLKVKLNETHYAASHRTPIGITKVLSEWIKLKLLLIGGRREDEYINGTTPFFWLTGSPAGRLLLQKQWVDFKPYMSKKVICQEVEAGVHKGKSAFHFLTAEEGTSHLTANWADFRVYLSPELLLQAAERGEEKGKPTFYYFAGRPGGRKLLDEHWDDFKGLISEKMLGQIAEEGEFKGINSFYWLTAYVDGIALLRKYWADFRPHLSRKILFQVAEEGPNKSLFPFYVLTLIPKGIAFLNQHWDDLKKYIPANILTMNIINELGGRESLQESLEKTCFGLAILERIKAHLASMPSDPLRTMGMFQPNVCPQVNSCTTFLSK